jgi:hypothetical protein
MAAFCRQLFWRFYMRTEKRGPSWCKTVVAALGMCAFGAIGTRSFAEVKPGDFITPDNAAQVKDVVAPGVY